jgi:large subunit ribosomal protein L30
VAEQNGKTVKIQLYKSPIGYTERQKLTVKALGLSRMNQVVEKPDNAAIRGMVESVRHLLKIVE